MVALAFYLFSSLLLMSAVGVVTARNTVHAVLFLILAFFNGAGLFILLGAEVLGMLLIIVYVGAVAVLFLFVVMMLETSSSSQRIFDPLPLGRTWRMRFWSWIKQVRIWIKRGGAVAVLPLMAGIVFLGEVGQGVIQGTISPHAREVIMAPMPPADLMSNAEALGLLIYKDYVYVFQASGLILLVGIIGAIVLTLRKKKNLKRQEVRHQVMRTRQEAVTVQKIPLREGI